MDNVLTIEDERLEHKIKQYFDYGSDLLNLLLPLLFRLGWQRDIRSLIESLPHFAEQLTLTEFRNLMVNLGFISEQKTGYLTTVAEHFLPCLFISDHNQAMLIEKNKIDINGDLTVIDGKTGTTKILTHHQITNLHGKFYIFSKVPPIEEEINQNWFLTNFKKFKWVLGQIFIIHLLYNVLSIGAFGFIMIIYDKIIPTGSINMLLSFSIGIWIVIGCMYMLTIIKNKMVAYTAVRLDKTVGYVIIKHILQLPPGYTDNATLYSQIARIKDFDNIRDFFSSQIAMLFFELPLSLVFVMAIMFIGGWLVAVPIMLAVIFYVLFLITDSLIKETIKSQNQSSILKQGFLLESFYNLRGLKACGIIKTSINKFNGIIANIAKYNFKLAMVNHVLLSTADLCMLLSATIILGGGTLLAMDNKLSSGALIAIMLLTWRILDPLKVFFISLPVIRQIKNSIQQVNNLINLPIETRKSDLIKINSVNTIELQKVSFRYPSQENAILLGVSFSMMPGVITCITGKNSTGKSTIIKLILALYHSQAGNVKINNMNINQLDPTALRKSIAYVPQDSDLFFGTIKQNLLLANPLATQAEIKQAAIMASVHEDIMRLKDNYDTHLGDQSILKLSSSFTQRMVLARAYLKDVGTLILDNPCHFINQKEEQDFVNTLQGLKKKFNRNIILVTSKILHLEIADQIIYLKGAQVALQGNRSEVLPKILEEYGIKNERNII